MPAVAENALYTAGRDHRELVEGIGGQLRVTVTFPDGRLACIGVATRSVKQLAGYRNRPNPDTLAG